MTITPEQFNKIALKEDVRDIVQEELAPIKENVHKMMNALDAISKTLSIRDDEKVANISAHSRFQTTLDDHEIRITKIEKVKVAA